MYRVKEVSDLFADACVRHPQTGAVLFLSIYGRDTAVLEFFASFSLPKTQGGLSEFTLLDADGAPSTVFVPEPSRLDKLTGKLPKTNLFGNLAQAWLFDSVITAADKANRTTWGLYPTHGIDGRAVDQQEIADRLWQQILDLSPVPLAMGWRDQVMTLLGQGFVTWLDEPDNLHPPLGPIMACRVDLNQRFVDLVAKSVKAGDLCVSA